MKCLETRRSGYLTMRRYRTQNDRRIKTMEIPWALWLRARSNVMNGLPGFERAEAARDRIALVKQLLNEGHKHEYVAAVTGLTRARVGQIKHSMKKGTPQ